jgi:ABC-2 type transport system ATP-binding protein
MTWGLDDVEVRLGGRTVLSGVTVSVEPGTVTALVGGDGAGKTTVLRTLLGLLRPAGGRVLRPDERRVGYLPAGSGVYPDLTVEENLAFAGAAHGLRGPVLRDRILPLLERTGLGEARRRLGANLSGGMRKKLGLAIAVLHRPDLLVLDEPSTGIDPVSRSELWRLVAGAAAAGAAVVFSSTYVDEAERAERVVVLDQGAVLAAGSPDDVLAAVPGAVVQSVEPPSTERRWRRGQAWRAWAPDGRVPPGSSRVDPDLQDAVTVAALATAEARP